MINELDGGIKGALNRALKCGNLRYKTTCALFDKMGYSNHEIQDLEVRNKVYKYLQKHYSKFLDTCFYDEKDSGAETNDVWICWLQGMNNAPDIVKVCYKSIKKWIPDKQIHVIDQDNLFDYVKLPNHVISKWKKGIISNTLFSDFIRLSVLTQFGGIWVDATVFFSGPLPDYIVRSDFFMYRCSPYDRAKFGESWFIKVEAHNYVIEETLKLLCEYWKRENKIRDYFQMFIFMKIVVSSNMDTIKNMVYIPNAIPHMLQNYLNHPFNEQIYNDICSVTNIHKLTYKNLNNNDGTFANFIIEKGYKEK